MALPSTFDSIRTSVIQKARLDAVDDKAKAGDWINTTYAEVASETRCFQQSATSSFTPGVATYTLDSAVLHLELLTVTVVGATASYPLVECSLDEILNLRASTSALSGTVKRYALIGLNQLEVWPTPTAADSLRTWYSKLPTYLSADGDIPALPEPHASNLLEYGALCQAAEFKRDLMMLGNFQQQYATAMQDFQKYLNRKSGTHPDSFPTWTTARGVSSGDPSVDVPAWDWSSV